MSILRGNSNPRLIRHYVVSVVRGANKYSHSALLFPVVVSRLLLHAAASKYNIEDGLQHFFILLAVFFVVCFSSPTFCHSKRIETSTQRSLATCWLATHLHAFLVYTTAVLCKCAWGTPRKPKVFAGTILAFSSSAGPAVLQQAGPVSCFPFPEAMQWPTHSLGGSESTYLHSPRRSFQHAVGATSVSACVSAVLSLQQAAVVPVPGEPAATIPVPGGQCYPPGILYSV
jgi:hypothetical protein